MKKIARRNFLKLVGVSASIPILQSLPIASASATDLSDYPLLKDGIFDFENTDITQYVDDVQEVFGSEKDMIEEMLSSGELTPQDLKQHLLELAEQPSSVLVERGFSESQIAIIEEYDGIEDAFDYLYIAHRQGCKIPVIIEAMENHRADQIPLAHQLNDLLGIVAEAQRFIFRNADALICFIEAGQDMRRIVRPDHSQIQNGRNCCKVRLCIAKFVLHDHVHKREEAGHRIIDMVDFLAHGVDGLCGIEINRIVHGRYLLNFCKIKDPIGSYRFMRCQRSLSR